MLRLRPHMLAIAGVLVVAQYGAMTGCGCEVKGSQTSRSVNAHGPGEQRVTPLFEHCAADSGAKDEVRVGTDWEGYDFFQRSVVKDLLHPQSYFSRMRPGGYDTIEMDAPVFVYAGAYARTLLQGTPGKGYLGRTAVTLVGSMDNPFPGYPTGIDYSGEAWIGQEGSRDVRLRINVDHWRESVPDGGVYRPTAYVYRLSSSEADEKPHSAKNPDRVAWYVWVHRHLAIPLTHVGAGSTHAMGIRVFSGDMMLIHPDGVEVDIGVSDDVNDDWRSVESDLCSTVVDLMWWRMGKYLGVSAGTDPRYILMLLPGTQFTYLRCLFKAEIVNSSTGRVRLNISQKANPFSRYK